jgi:hypothetical protein
MYWIQLTKQTVGLLKVSGDSILNLLLNVLIPNGSLTISNVGWFGIQMGDHFSGPTRLGEVKRLCIFSLRFRDDKTFSMTVPSISHVKKSG